MNDIENSILNAIRNLINKKIKQLKFDYTISGKILTDNGDGTFNILYNEQTLENVKARAGLILIVNDIVYIKCIQGNFSEKFIDCKRP